MAAVNAIQSALDAYGIKILKSETRSATVDAFLCQGGATAPGRHRWVETTSSQTAAQQATTIRNALQA